ncbi:MAG: hypothetical protein KJ649_08740 [Proteobacteria bacterium]|nr:hypothetical protein [Pseudomonadota bacterium]
MSKKVFFLLIITTFCLSCATFYDIDMYRSKGYSIATTYNHDWENVYDVMKIVLNNDEDLSIYLEKMNCTLEYAKGEKRIWVTIKGLGMGAGIYFSPLSDSKTKVEFVRSRFNKIFFSDEEIEQIFKKSMDILRQNAMGSWC